MPTAKKDTGLPVRGNCIFWTPRRCHPHDTPAALRDPALGESSRIGYVAGMKPFLTRWLVTTLAVLVVSSIPGIGVHASGLAPLVEAGLLLGIFNAFVRPVLLLLSLPLILFSMGLFIFVVNAVCLLAAAGLLPGFYVDSFGSALIGSVLISFVSWILSIFFRGSDGKVHPITRHETMKTVRGRVIE